MRDVRRLMSEKQFDTVEEANAYLATLSGPGLQQALQTAAPLSNKEEAQELAWQAMEAETAEQARSLAERALAKDPDCVDAIVVLTELEANSPKDVIAGLERAVAAGERSLGARFFAENKGHFWGLLETRPYMRARVQLAELLRSLGHGRKAIGHYEALLELNPNDNQGVRDLLLGCYLAHSELAAATKLLKRYERDSMATFAWGRVLERFLAGDRKGAERALKMARKRNRFVELYFSGLKKLPDELSETYSLGSEEEAILCFDHLAAAWLKHQPAMFWLLSHVYGPASPPVG